MRWDSAGTYGMPFPRTFPGLSVGMCVVFLCSCYYLVILLCSSCFSSTGCVTIVADHTDEPLLCYVVLCSMINKNILDI